jgi:hypothetical protein
VVLDSTAEELVRILDRLATTLVELEDFRELRKGFRSGVTATGHPRLQVFGGDRAVILADELDTFEIVALSGGARHLPQCWVIREINVRLDSVILETVPSRRVHSVYARSVLARRACFCE